MTAYTGCQRSVCSCAMGATPLCPSAGGAPQFSPSPNTTESFIESAKVLAEPYQERIAALTAERDAALQRAEQAEVRAEDRTNTATHWKLRAIQAEARLRRIEMLRCWPDGVTGRRMVYADEVFAALDDTPTTEETPT